MKLGLLSNLTNNQFPWPHSIHNHDPMRESPQAKLLLAAAMAANGNVFFIHTQRTYVISCKQESLGTNIHDNTDNMCKNRASFLWNIIEKT